MKHDDRLILDDKVYNIYTGDLLTKFEQVEKLLDGILVSKDHILVSHDHYCWMTLYVWDGETYNKISRRRTIATFNDHARILALRHNPFEDSINVVYFVVATKIFRMETDLKELKDSKIDQIGLKSTQVALDFAFIDVDHYVSVVLSSFCLFSISK